MLFEFHTHLSGFSKALQSVYIAWVALSIWHQQMVLNFINFSDALGNSLMVSETILATLIDISTSKGMLKREYLRTFGKSAASQVVN